MIPLEIVLALVDSQRANIIAMLENPSDRTEFGFGDLAGRLRSLNIFREELNDFVEQNQRGSDDNG